MERQITSARTRTIGFGAGGWLLGLLAVAIAVNLARRGAPQITVDVTGGEAPADVAQRHTADAMLWALAALACGPMLLYWSQNFIGWIDVLRDYGPTQREFSERLEVSGLGARFWVTVVPVHLVVLALLVQLVLSFRRALASFRQTEPEFAVPALVRRWAVDEAVRRANAQYRLREKYALAQALQSNNGNPADLARTAEEIRALEAQVNQPIPPVEQWLGELVAALASKRAELAVLRRNGAPPAAVAAASGAITELRGRLVGLGGQVSSWG